MFGRRSQRFHEQTSGQFCCQIWWICPEWSFNRWDSQSIWTKALTSHLFTPLFMFIHLPLIYFPPPPRLLIDFKNSKWLTYFCISLCICYCFSHLIGLRSITWLSLLYKFTRFSIYFLFLSDEGPMLETLDYTILIGSTPSFLYFDLYLYSAYAAHFVYSI